MGFFGSGGETPLLAMLTGYLNMMAEAVRRMEEVCGLRRWDNGSGMHLGVYISVPFCRTKCSYCNFASDVFSRAVFERYVDRVCADIENAPQVATEIGGRMERAGDSIYLGGGTPTVLQPAQLERIFATVRSQFDVRPKGEGEGQCAPRTFAAAKPESLLASV